jgi:bifunctional non-homologous end joining protein LigD
VIDGEVFARDDGTPDFHALRSQRRGHEAVAVAFDLSEHDGSDLRDLPLLERKRRLAKLIGKSKTAITAIQYGQHLRGDVFSFAVQL